MSVVFSLPINDISAGGAVVPGAEGERVRPAFAAHVVRGRQLLLPAEGARDGAQVLPGNRNDTTQDKGKDPRQQ